MAQKLINEKDIKKRLYFKLSQSGRKPEINFQTLLKIIPKVPGNQRKVIA